MMQIEKSRPQRNTLDTIRDSTEDEVYPMKQNEDLMELQKLQLQ